MPEKSKSNRKSGMNDGDSDYAHCSLSGEQCALQNSENVAGNNTANQLQIEGSEIRTKSGDLENLQWRFNVKTRASEETSGENVTKRERRNKYLLPLIDEACRLWSVWRISTKFFEEFYGCISAFEATFARRQSCRSELIPLHNWAHTSTSSASGCASRSERLEASKRRLVEFSLSKLVLSL